MLLGLRNQTKPVAFYSFYFLPNLMDDQSKFIPSRNPVWRTWSIGTDQSLSISLYNYWTNEVNYYGQISTNYQQLY